MKGSTEEPGCIPLALQDLFQIIEQPEKGIEGEEGSKEKKVMEREIKISYIEIYNEKINDLLCRTNSNLKIKMNEDKTIFLQNLSQIAVNSAQQAFSLL